jgi:hypothetical protein
MGIFEHNMIMQELWRPASESESSLRFFFRFQVLFCSYIALVFLFFPNNVLAENTISNPQSYYFENPYVPQSKDYGLELGSMQMESGLYWLGLNFGLHAGNCVFYKDSSCQQYYDFGFGAGGRDGETQYIGSLSARFQWVRYPSSWSPFSRIYAGVLNTIYSPRSDHYPTYGVGVGITHRLHKNLDLRLEMRVGYGYQGYVQGIVGLQLKIDEVIKDFANKVKNLPGNVIEGTVEGTKKVIKGIGDAVTPNKDK